MGLLAGAFAIFTAFTNAFGAVTLALAALCLLVTLPWREISRAAAMSLGVVVVAYAAVSVFVPPSVIHAIRVNSPTVGGDYQYTARSCLGLAALVIGFVLLWLGTAGAKASPWRRCIILFAV